MVPYKGTPICISSDFSAETLQAGEEWNNILKVLKEKLAATNTLASKVIILI